MLVAEYAYKFGKGLLINLFYIFKLVEQHQQQ